MSIYNIINIGIVLASSTLMACSSDKSEPTSITKMSPIVQQNEQQRSAETHGLEVYIDPKTGEFLDSPPPPDPNAPVVAKSVVGQNKLLVPVYSDLKASTVEAGGSYIEVIKPLDQQKVYTRRSK